MNQRTNAFWQVFRYIPTTGPPHLVEIPGMPPPSEELKALVAAAGPGESLMVVAHCQPFDTMDDAAHDILDHDYPEADAFVVRAETSREAISVLADGALDQVRWIGKTTVQDVGAD